MVYRNIYERDAQMRNVEITNEPKQRRKPCKKRKKKQLTKYILLFLLIIGIVFILKHNPYLKNYINNPNGVITVTIPDKAIKIKESFLTPNPYSRPQTPLSTVTSIVIHYTGNPNTSAKANRNYFENLKIHRNTYASSHFVIGLKGEIIQCLPLNEISYASNHRNNDTISIESCHPDASGKFTKQTYNSLVALVATLCYNFDLGKDDIIRHYDVTGKLCPLYYVEHEDEWEEFKNDVMNYLETIKWKG